MYGKEPRFRISAKQNSHNKWQIDATIEHNNTKITKSTNKDDLGDTSTSTLGEMLWGLISDAEDKGRQQGRQFVSDKKE